MALVCALAFWLGIRSRKLLVKKFISWKNNNSNKKNIETAIKDKKYYAALTEIVNTVSLGFTFFDDHKFYYFTCSRIAEILNQNDSSIMDISDLIIELKKYDIYVIASSSAKHIIFSILSEDSIETETNKFFIALKRHNERP